MKKRIKRKKIVKKKANAAVKFYLSFNYQFQYVIIQFYISVFLWRVPIVKNTEDQHQVTNHNNPASEFT